MAENELRSRESHVVIPFQQSLISGVALAMLVGVAVLGMRRWTGSDYGWVEIALLFVASFALGFAGIWALLLYALRPERERVQEPRLAEPRPAQASLDVAMPVMRPAFSAHDALRFVRDALVMVNGEWQDKDGGSSQREMARKGWSRDEWEMAVGWLLENGILEWRNPAAHQQGTRWNIQRLNRFVGRE